MSLGHLLTGTGAIAVALTAWWSRSQATGPVGLLVGVAYVMIGGFIVALPALFGWLCVSVNNAPTVAPEPIARFLSDRYTDLAGVSGSGFAIGGAMFVAGVAVLIAAVPAGRARSAAAVQARPEPPAV